MKLILLFLFVSLLSTITSYSQGEQFTKTVINNAYDFEHPFDMFLGPDDSLWINERSGLISKVHKTNGGRRIILNIKNQVTFTRSFSGSTVTGIAQDGMFGMALHPMAMKGMGKDSLYVAYCYNGAASRKTKIVKFYCNPNNNLLTNETVLIQDLPGSNDHNGGKLVFGPDLEIYYSCGDQGANQFGNACVALKSQLDITSAQLLAGNYANYAGHILRINTDGTVPLDNPLFSSVRSHVYSKGHRNPQGLVWQKNVWGDVPSNGFLYESEQGAVIDDEVNIIESGKNYGWPFISGYNDDVFYTYKNWSVSSGCGSYSGECATAGDMTGANAPKAESSFLPASNYTNAIMSQKAVASPDCSDYLLRPTVAWSSIEFYNPYIGIPGWSNSLLLTTLKNSSLLRYKLNASGNAIVGDTIQYFRNSAQLNRFRDIAIGSDGITLYMITDSLGATSGVTAGGGTGTGGSITNRGKLLAYRYTGTAQVLSLTPNQQYTANRDNILNIYPNPATDYITVNTKYTENKPYTLKLINSLGVVIVQTTITSNIQNVNLTKLANGHYVAIMYNRNNIEISKKKLVVQH